MDKLRLSISGEPNDFARIYSMLEPGGLNSIQESITLPADQTLLLCLISQRVYDLVLEGDASLCTEQAPEEADESWIRFFYFDWSEEAQKRGEGKALIKLVNQDLPDQPGLINLELGEFKYTPQEAIFLDSPTEENSPFSKMPLAIYNNGMPDITAQEVMNRFFDNQPPS